MPTKSHSDQPAPSSDPWWMVLCGLFVLALCLIALPAIAIGFVAQRIMARLLSWRWSFGIWVLLLIPCLYFLIQWYEYSLQVAMIHELIGYFLAAMQYQYDLARWPWKPLWAQTWPLWVQTLMSIPIAGFWFEVTSHLHGTADATTQMLERERDREQKQARAQRQAKKRTSHPERMADVVADAMVMGVPIHDEEQE